MSVYGAQSTSDHLLELKNLTTRFYTEDGVVHAVSGVSYALEEGDTLGVVGESGCGKSVHALSVMRLIPIPPGRIEEGEVFFRGRDLLKLSDDEMRHVRGAQIAMVFQDPMTSLNPVLTVGFQIMEALKLHQGMSDEEARDRAGELLAMVGIPEAAQRLDDYPHQFSGGMRQRVMIAIALSCHPQILIADEPTTALDVTIQAQIIDIINRLRDELDMSIIWITHDLGIIAGIADRVLVMYGGFIVEEAPVKELYSNPKHPYTQGLLGSLPKIGKRDANRLVSIKGQPPSLPEDPQYCPFFPRCLYAIDKCRQENPIMFSIDHSHSVACWWDIEKGEPRVDG